MLVDHTYGDILSLQVNATGGLTSATPSTYNLNDLFAPEVVNAHQPYGFDQMTPLYKKFKVHSATITVQTLTTAAGIWLHVAFASPNAGFSYAGASAYAVSEQPGATSYLLTPSVVHHTVKGIDMPTLCNVTKQEYDADVSMFVGTGAASPSSVAKCYLALSTPGAASGYTALLQVRITYKVEWFDRITLAAS